MYPRVTIGILNYRYDNFLPEAIESAVNQDYKNKEIMVVYNGIEDRASIPYFKGVDRVVVLKDNIKCPGGKNTIFKCSDSEWIFHLDADDLLNKSYSISRLIEIAQETSADLVFPNTESKFLLSTLKIHNPYSANNLMSRKVWKILHGWQYDPIIVEDWDFWIRIAKYGKFRVETTPEDLWFHREHKDAAGAYLGDSKEYAKLYNAIKERYKDLYE